MEVSTDGAGLTYKRARTADERRRIGHEAAVLRRVAHPGIVQLLKTEGADPPQSLVLRTVSGGDLTTLGRPTLPVIAGLGAAVATTMADLHALGFCHGGIEASHVLLDEAGRPVLCSLSGAKAVAAAPDADRQQHEDLRALAVMLLQLLPPDGSIRVARMLRGLATARRLRWRRDASWLARRLVSMVPDARLPDPAGAGQSAAVSAPADHGRRADQSGSLRRIRAVPSGRLAGAGVGLCLLVTGAVVLADRGGASVLSHRNSTSEPSPPSVVPERSLARASSRAPAPCPVVDNGCVPISSPGGVVIGPAGRYAVGQPGDVVVTGRWECRPTAFLALLRPGTGDIWAFDSWATSDDAVVGRLVGRVASARSLRVVPGSSGCDGLEVDRRGLPPVTLPVLAR